MAHAPAVAGARAAIKLCAGERTGEDSTQAPHAQLACPLSPLIGAHDGEWDLRRSRFVCLRCKVLIRGRETVDTLGAALAELGLYRQHLDLDQLRRPDLPAPVALVALALRVLGTYLVEDGEDGARIAANFRAAGLELPGRAEREVA